MLTSGNQSFKPYLDNTGTRGEKSTPLVLTDNQKMVSRNYNRISRISHLKREGLKLSKQAEHYAKTTKLNADEHSHL